MSWLYTLAISSYVLAIRLGSFLGHKKARAWLRGRQLDEKQRNQALSKRKAGQPLYWMHCASTGEFEQGRALLEALQRERPEAFWVLSFFSPSGYQAYHGKLPTVDYICYLPADRPRAMRQFLDALQPNLALFVKYELWQNCLRELAHRAVPSYLFAAVFRPEQLFFRPWGSFFFRGLQCFSAIYTQRDESRQLLISKGYSPEKVKSMGDPRFDRVLQIREAGQEIPYIGSFVEMQRGRILVAGSTWPADEELLAQCFAQFEEQEALILVPHELDEEHIQNIRKHFAPFSPILYSELEQGKEPGAGCRVCIVDAMGLLSRIYRFGDFAYIGGGFGAGIHNSLEAAIYGIPLAFGPRYHKFAEARDLIRLGFAQCWENSEQALAYWQKLDDKTLEKKKVQLGQYMQEQTGAAERIAKAILL